MEWQPIETAPKDGTMVDLWLDSGLRLADANWNGRCWVGINWRQDRSVAIRPDDPQPTHWRTLPAPPSKISELEARAATGGHGVDLGEMSDDQIRARLLDPPTDKDTSRQSE